MPTSLHGRGGNRTQPPSQSAPRKSTQTRENVGKRESKGRRQASLAPPERSNVALRLYVLHTARRSLWQEFLELTDSLAGKQLKRAISDTYAEEFRLFASDPEAVIAARKFLRGDK